VNKDYEKRKTAVFRVRLHFSESKSAIVSLCEHLVTVL